MNVEVETPDKEDAFNLAVKKLTNPITGAFRGYNNSDFILIEVKEI